MKLTGYSVRAAAAVACAAVLFAQCSGNKAPEAKKALTVSGSTTVLPIAQKAAEMYMEAHNDANISIRGGGSGVGITALIDGRVDVANASRAIKDKEVKLAEAKGVPPHANVVANDGIAVVVHKDNPVGGITIEKLRKVYTGEISNWKELGGKNLEIVIVSRDVSSGTFEVFNHLVMNKKKVKDGALMVASNKAAATTVAQTPGGIGYVGLSYLDNTLKAVTVDGREPTVAAVQAGSYPLARKLFMYTKGVPQGLAKDYIGFILSAAGQKIVADLGYVPVE